MCSSLGTAAEAAFNLERMSADDFGRIKNVKMIRGSRNLAGREIALGEIESLVRTCQAQTSPAANVESLHHIGFGIRRMPTRTIRSC